MAELATIARPYAEALDRSVDGADALALIPQLQALAAVAGNPDMRSWPTTRRSRRRRCWA